MAFAIMIAGIFLLALGLGVGQIVKSFWKFLFP